MGASSYKKRDLRGVDSTRREKRMAGVREIAYVPSPTAERMHNSLKRVRGIRGPIGCLPCDTEVMTPDGWIRIADWDGQEILQWRPDGTTVFAAPRRFINAACEDEMIVFDRKPGSKTMRTDGFGMMLTGNHRVAAYNWAGRFVVKSAEELARKMSKHTIPTHFDGPGSLDMGLDEIRLWVAVCGDGSYPKAGKQCEFRFHKQRKVERLESLLGRMGIGYSKSVRWREDKSAFETKIVIVRPSFPKHFDWRLSGVSREQAEAFTEELQYWDGLYGYDYDRWDGTNEADAKIVQYVAACAGRRATVVVNQDGRAPDRWAPIYTVYIAKRGSAKNKSMVRCDGTVASMRPAPDGRQYCFETDTGFFVVRQFGNVFVTGNSGKSVACCWDIRYRTERMPPDSLGVRHARWLIARSTFAQIKKTTIPTWLRWFPDTEIKWGSPTTGVLRQPSMRGDGTTVEIELIFQGIRFNESLESLKSLDLSGAWMNEASDIRADALDAVLGRCGRYPDTSMVPGAVNLGVTMDTNSPGETNWWYQLAELRRPEDYDFFAQPPAVFRRERDGRVWYEANRGQEEGVPAAENAGHLADGYDYWLNLAKGASPDYVKRFLMNEYTNEVQGAPVYHEYIDALHFVDEDVEPMWGMPLVLGTDYGRTPSSVILQVRPDSQVVVFDELCTRDCSIDEYVDRWLKPWLINRFRFGQGARIVSYGDPAGANKEQGVSMSVIQIMTQKGVPTMPCPVPNNDFMLRRDAVGDSLRRRVTEGKPGLVICRPCVNLRKGFLGGYHYRQMANADGSVRTADRPDKSSDDPSSHVHDALQYAVYSVLHPDGRDPFSTRGADAKLWLPRSEAGSPRTVGLDLAGYF